MQSPEMARPWMSPNKLHEFIGPCDLWVKPSKFAVPKRIYIKSYCKFFNVIHSLIVILYKHRWRLRERERERQREKGKEREKEKEHDTTNPLAGRTIHILLHRITPNRSWPRPNHQTPRRVRDQQRSSTCHVAHCYSQARADIGRKDQQKAGDRH